MSERFDRQRVRGNIYTSYEKTRREVELLKLRQVNPAALEKFMSWAEETGDDGVLPDRNTASTYNAQIAPIVCRQPIKIFGITWLIRNAGTYELRQLWEPNIASYHEVLYSGAAITDAIYGGNYMINVSLTTPITLTAGTHYFGVYTTPAVTWQDYNATSYLSADAAWAIAGIYYNTSTASYTAPVRLWYQLGTWE